MSILKALKDLIRKMGGSTHAGNIAEAIRDIPTNKPIPNSIIVKSSTESSTKIFAITVNDSGTITASEVV